MNKRNTLAYRQHVIKDKAIRMVSRLLATSRAVSSHYSYRTFDKNTDNARSEINYKLSK